MNAAPKLPLSEFSFSYWSQKNIVPSLLTPSLWHGIFGNALRERVCMVPGATECKSCMFLHQCDYPFLFEGVRPLNAESTHSSPDIPVPHVFKIITEQTNHLPNPQQINFSVILIGEATQRLVVLIKAMSLAGTKGIGKDRIPLQLIRVKQNNSYLPQLILENDVLYSPSPAQRPSIPDVPETIQLIFKTPYRSNKARFDTVFFLMQLIRRISSLQCFYTSQPLDADFKQLKVLANKAQVDLDIFSQKDSRYSARHKQKIETGGFMGKLTLKMTGIEELWPYLYLGQWLHVGKNASFGYGCYELLELK